MLSSVMYEINVSTFEEWREHARELLKRDVHPTTIVWVNGNQQVLSFCEDSYLEIPTRRISISLPREFVIMAESVACYQDDQRWGLLYSVAWRITNENRKLLHHVIDPQVFKLRQMQKTIARDIHKMEAFVRFKKIPSEKIPEYFPFSENQECYVAWFEPEHWILPQVAPFFVKRFTNMCWSILTPDICMHWDTKTLEYSPGIPKPESIEDELDLLWIEYYKSTFNPARLKLKAMQSEMPKKYWVNLPEAPHIAELARSSHSKMMDMIQRENTSDWEKTAKSKLVHNSQKILRHQRSSVITQKRAR